MEKMPWIELPLTNSPLKAKVDGDYDGEYFSQFRWALGPNGYVHCSMKMRVNGKLTQGWVYLHREVARPPKGMWVRFINGDKRDCRSANLTWQTPTESALRRESRYTPEQKAQRIMKSKLTRRAKRRARPGRYMGVTTHRNEPSGSERWYAQIALVRADGKRQNKYLGSHTSPELAARTYDLAEIKRHGFAKAITNFPKSDYLIKKEPK